jgi:hypothetical protein
LQKIAVIFLFLLTVESCSIVKDQQQLAGIGTNGNSSGDLLEKTEEKNLTKNSLFIKNLSIEITNDVEKSTLKGSIRFEKNNRYLLTLRTETGIEVSRIFVSEDTVIMQDKIGRKIYYVSDEYLKNKFGIQRNMLPVVFGDYLGEKYFERNIISEKDGVTTVSLDKTGTKLKYEIDNKISKVVELTIGIKNEDSFLRILYKYKSKGINNKIPETVTIIGAKESFIIEMKFKKIEIPWDGNIIFRPEGRYKRIDLK